MKKILIFAISLFLVFGCIDPIKFSFKDQVKHLVVEGTFDNISGPHTIKLGLSSPFDYPYNIIVPDATVSVSSLEGENYMYTYASSGIYYAPDSAKVIPGHTYMLTIKYQGNIYQSENILTKKKDEIEPIQKLHFTQNNRSTIVYGQKSPSNFDGFDILVDFLDQKNIKNFYKWSYKRRYEVITQPEDYIDYECRGCPMKKPKPCCKTCLVSEEAQILSVANDWLIDGSQITGKVVMFIPFYQYLNRKLELNIYQHSISEGAYNYFNALRNQSQSTGSMFDAPPTQLKSNVFNIKDPSEQVIGYFQVSTATSKFITIKSADVNSEIPRFIYPDDCLSIPGSTTKIPFDW